MGGGREFYAGFTGGAVDHAIVVPVTGASKTRPGLIAIVVRSVVGVCIRGAPLNCDNGRLHLDGECHYDRTMTEDLTRKIVAWATEIAKHAVALPSGQARETYFSERHRELVAGAVTEGAVERDARLLADA